MNIKINQLILKLKIVDLHFTKHPIIIVFRTFFIIMKKPFRRFFKNFKKLKSRDVMTCSDDFFLNQNCEMLIIKLSNFVTYSISLWAIDERKLFSSKFKSMDDFDSALIIDEITGADDTPLSEALPQAKESAFIIQKILKFTTKNREPKIWV